MLYFEEVKSELLPLCFPSLEVNAEMDLLVDAIFLSVSERAGGNEWGAFCFVR